MATSSKYLSPGPGAKHFAGLRFGLNSAWGTTCKIHSRIDATSSLTQPHPSKSSLLSRRRQSLTRWTGMRVPTIDINAWRWYHIIKVSRSMQNLIVLAANLPPGNSGAPAMQHSEHESVQLMKRSRCSLAIIIRIKYSVLEYVWHCYCLHLPLQGGTLGLLTQGYATVGAPSLGPSTAQWH